MTQTQELQALIGPGSVPNVQRRTRQGVVRRILRLIWSWHERSRQRHQLAMLSDRMLRDIGLTRHEIETEFGKAPWQE